MTGDDVDPDNLAAPLRMAVVRLARRLRLEDSASSITLSQLSALAVVERLGPMTLRDLAARERVQPPTMTRLVAALEEDGLVVREGHPTDGRVVLVTVTGAGRDVLAASRQRRTEFLSAQLALCSDTERTTLHDSLALLERLADA